MPVPGRSKLDNDYRYGFNGMETDPEAKGTWGNQNTTYFRQYDARLGRWMSLDPVTHEFQSPYNAMDGNPIYYADPSGADGNGPGDKQKPKENKVKVGKGTVKSSDGTNIETTSGTNYVLNKDCNCVVYSSEAPEQSQESQYEYTDYTNLLEEEELEAEEFGELIPQGNESTASWEDYSNKKEVFIASTPGSDFKSSLGWYYQRSGIKARNDAIVREEQGRRLAHMMAFSFWPAPAGGMKNLSGSRAAARYRATVVKIRALEPTKMELYRNFGIEEYNLLRSNGNKWKIGSEFGSKQFWMDKEGLTWWLGTTFSNKFTAKIIINRSALKYGYQFKDIGKYKAISYDSQKALDIFNKNMKIKWVEY